MTRSRTLRALPVWAAMAVILVQLDAPWWIRLPVVGSFSLLGAGLATVLVLRITQPAIVIAVVVAVGFSSLILASLIPLWLIGESALATLVIQAVTVWVLSVWALRDEWRTEAT